MPGRAQVADSPAGRSHELAAAFLRRADGAVGSAGPAGDMVAAEADATQAADRGLSAAENPCPGPQARRDAASKPLVVDIASAVDGRPCRHRARRTSLQSARKAAGGRLG